ncbi:MAG: HEAT repeat domain-containing protein [Planctomycetota bacterium]|jgi:hypothetical protein
MRLRINIRTGRPWFHVSSVLLCLLHLSLPPLGRADVVYLRAGQPISGWVVEDSPEHVRVNTHNSDNTRMKYQVVTIPRARIVKVVMDRPKVQEYLKRAARLKSGEDAEKHFELAQWCKKNKLKTQMKERARAALLADGSHEGASKLLGSAAKKFLKEQKKFVEEIAPRIEEYTLNADPASRKDLYRKIKGAGFKKPKAYLDRIARSLGAVKGKHLDRKIVYRAEEFPGTVYSLFVPGEYDPTRTWPLVLGLHGGGAAGKDGKEVVGDGPSAMMKYQAECSRRGYILVCPTAISAPWPNPVNERFITALLTELVLTYHVDLNRVYLVGHSMGGGGTWHYGPKWAETFASIAPLSAYSCNGMRILHKTLTGVYIYHGDDDNRCPVDSSRRAAKAFNGMKADYRYTEIPGSGHSCPMYIVAEVFDFFDAHRLVAAKKPSLFGVRPRGWGEYSSFTLPVTPQENKYLVEREATGVVALVRKLSLGGGGAVKAAAEIPKQEDREKAVHPLKALLAHSENEDVRCLAARALGGIGSEKAVPILGQAMNDDKPEVRSESAEALASIGGDGARAQLGKGAARVREHFEKRLSGSSMDSVDWEAQVEAVTRFLEAAAQVGDGETGAAVGKEIFQGILLKPVTVEYDREVQPDPARSRNRLALAALKTLEKLGGPSEATYAGILAQRPGFSKNVVAEARRVASALGRE